MKIKLEIEAVKDKDGKDILPNSIILHDGQAIIIDCYFDFLYCIQYSDEHSGLNNMSSEYFELLGQHTSELKVSLREKGIYIKRISW